MKAMDSHGVDWRDWLLTNLAAGCSADDMCLRMADAGWPEALARPALNKANMNSSRSGAQSELVPR